MMDLTEEPLLQDAGILASRLERLSADSHWAHRASGLRGALLRCLEVLGQPETAVGSNQEEIEQAWQALPDLLSRGQVILQHAARAIRTPDTQFD